MYKLFSHIFLYYSNDIPYLLPTDKQTPVIQLAQYINYVQFINLVYVDLLFGRCMSLRMCH